MAKRKGKVLGFSAVKSPMTELKEAENQHPAEKQASTKGVPCFRPEHQLPMCFLDLDRNSRERLSFI
ncbi:hypothetical protein INR49_000520 [Caranx melampygus]|nr:hypothetical protein INR49_000520 [Caranx melampygus]